MFEVEIVCGCCRSGCGCEKFLTVTLQECGISYLSSGCQSIFFTCLKTAAIQLLLASPGCPPVLAYFWLFVHPMSCMFMKCYKKKTYIGGLDTI